MYLNKEKAGGKRKNTFGFQLISDMWNLLTVKDDKNRFNLRTLERANLSFKSAPRTIPGPLAVHSWNYRCGVG